jgi:hypothetical protein
MVAIEVSIFLSNFCRLQESIINSGAQKEQTVDHLVSCFTK